jgi:hypothetical protein
VAHDRDPPPAVGLGQQVGGEGADPDVAPDLAQAADSQSGKPAPSRWKMVDGSTSSTSASCTTEAGLAAKLPLDRSRSAAAALRSARLERVGVGVSDPPVDAVTSDWVTPDPFPLEQHDRDSLVQQRSVGQIASPGPLRWPGGAGR